MTIQNLPVQSLQRLKELDLALCICCNRVGNRRVLQRFFGIVSRLGDGVFWYTLMLILPLTYGYTALPAVATMASTGLLCLLVYSFLKHKTSRPRPYSCNHVIQLSTMPLDQFSFPSGHTLHAVGFSAVALHYFPGLFWLLLPFSVLVALSRLVLGLHYPSDVLAGAALGLGISTLVMQSMTMFVF